MQIHYFLLEKFVHQSWSGKCLTWNPRKQPRIWSLARAWREPSLAPSAGASEAPAGLARPGASPGSGTRVKEGLRRPSRHPRRRAEARRRQRGPAQPYRAASPRSRLCSATEGLRSASEGLHKRCGGLRRRQRGPAQCEGLRWRQRRACARPWVVPAHAQGPSARNRGPRRR